MLFSYRRKPAQPNLRITEVTPAQELGEFFRPHSYISPNMFRITADRPLWATIGKTVTYASVTLERVLTAHPKQQRIPYQIAYQEDPNRTAYNNIPDVEESDQMWITSGLTGDHEPPTVDNLNEIIASSPTPDVRFMRSAEHPGLITAHRSVAIGQFAANAAAGLPAIQSAKRMGTNLHSPVPFSVYPDSTLLMAVAEPGVKMQQAETDLRSVLTL